MKASGSLAVLLESFFTQRLMKQRLASPHTIKSYRDTFHLLLQFSERQLGKQPSQLELADIDALLITGFLDDMEKNRGVSSRTRNARLAAIRSFFRYAAFEAPAQSAQIQRVLAIPGKKHIRALVGYLTRPEIEALLAAPNRRTWSGRRDHALILLGVQTGLRLSELTGLQRHDVVLGSGAHVRVIGKGRKERCTPLTKQTARIIQSWIQEPTKSDSQIIFPSARGGRLSADGVQYILNNHTKTASQKCLSLNEKRVTPHLLRHTCAVELLQAGVELAMIALWLGHESIETTRIYLNANLALKEEMLAKTTMPEGSNGCYRPGDQLMAFLRGL